MQSVHSRRVSSRKSAARISRAITLDALENRLLFSLPAGWSSADIGSPALAGSSSYSGGTYSMSGSGTDIWGTSDQFQYASKSATGDGTISAEVTSETNTNVWTKAGVEIRDSSGAGAIEASVFATPGNGVSFQWRNSTGGGSSNVALSGVPIPTPTNPVWVELQKSGTNVSGYYSLNGINYTQIGTSQTIAYTQSPYLAGLAVTSHDNTQLASATITNVVTAFASDPPLAPSVSAVAARYDAANISWSSAANATGYYIYRGTTSGDESTTPLNSSPITTTSYTDATLSGGSIYYYTVKAVNSYGSSAASAEASASTPTGVPVLAINSGGSAVGGFVADTDATGGTTFSNSDTINTSNVFNPAPASVYNSERDGSFTYTIPSLTPGAVYTVRLHFADVVDSAAGQREFNVNINGAQVLTNFDTYADAGGKDIADIKEFNTTANSSGQIVISYTNVIGQAESSGIEILQQGLPPAIPNAASTLVAVASSPTAISLSWNNNNSSGVVGVAVDRSPDGNNWTTLSTLSAGSTSYTNSSLTTAKLYYYRIREINSAGFSSAPSNTSSAKTLAAQSTAPAAPSGLTVSSYSAFENNISWSNNTTTQAGVIIERSTDGQNYAPVGSVSSAESSYTDSGLTPSTIYFYRVRSYNSAGYSSYLASTNPVWLRLVKTGSSISAFVSSDGVNYSPYGSSVTVNFSNSTFLAGVYATSHENNTLTNAVFLGLTTTSTAGSYSDSDIGSPGLAGSAVQLGTNGYYLQGSGNGVYDAPDQCNFESVPVTGDQTITVEVTSMSNTGTNFAEAGIMLRDSNANNAAYATLFAEPAPGNKGVAFDWRSTGGGHSNQYGVNTIKGPQGNYAYTSAAINTVVGTATYLTGAGGNDVTNSVDTQPNGTIVEGGTLYSSNFGVTPTVLNGGTTGNILLLNSTGTQVLGVTQIGTTVSEVQVNQSNGDILAVGDFGAVLLDPTGTTILQTYTGFTGTAYRCAIGTDGTVAILSSAQGSSNPAGGELTVYNSANVITGQSTFPDTARRERDIAIDPVSQQVYLVGDYFGQIPSGQSGPVQVAALFAFNYSMTSTWTDYNASTTDLTQLAADTYGWHISLGRDGYLYFEGESAGGNSQFNKSPTNINNPALNYGSDNYNQASNTASNQICYVTKLNPATGAQIVGTYTLTRLDNGKGNSNFARDGITADFQGNVFIMGNAAYQIANRDSNELNGQPIPAYNGDLYLLELSPNFSQRKIWTSFGESAVNGEGGIAVSGATVVLGATVNVGVELGYYGPLYTTPNALQYAPNHVISSSATGGWLAVFNTSNVPGTTTGASASAVNSSDMHVTWNPVAGANAYNIYRGNSPGSESTTPLNTFPVTGTSYEDLTVSGATTYYYVVKAVNAAGSGGASNEATATTPTGLPAWVDPASVATWDGTTDTLTVTGAATIIANPAGALASISIGSGGTLTLAGNIGQLSISSLSVTTGGRMNIENNSVLLNYGATDPAANILALLKTGSNGGLWNGAGINSSTANANINYGVAYADGADGVASNLSSGQIEVAYTLLGDIKLTRTVNALDFGILAGNFGQSVTGGWEQGDLNYDGYVNATDFSALAGNFGKSASIGASIAVTLPATTVSSTTTASSATAVTSVPSAGSTVKLQPTQTPGVNGSKTPTKKPKSVAKAAVIYVGSTSLTKNPFSTTKKRLLQN